MVWSYYPNWRENNMPKIIDLTGKTFGELTVHHKSGSRNGSTTWECACSCGEVILTPTTSSLMSGNTKSCGCLKKKKAKDNLPNPVNHGESKTRLYQC